MKTRRSRTPEVRSKVTPHEYDAALSFAGEDRKHAKSLAVALRARGLKVFYDNDHLPRLWGRSSTEFEQIYGPRSRFVIAFISKHYANKDWTRFEFDSAKREEKRRKAEFILPIRLDDTRLFGLHDDRTYLSLNERSVREVAAIFSDKCKSSSVPLSSRRQTDQGSRLLVLNAGQHTALGLVASSGPPLTVDHYKALFPDLRWSTILKSLTRRGIIILKGRLLYARQGMGKRLLRDEQDRKALHLRWITTLEPLRYYKDLAPYLAYHYIRLHRFDDAALLLSGVASAVDLGVYSDMYITGLEVLLNHGNNKHLSEDSTLSVLNALGIALSKTRRFDESLRYLARLRQRARLAKNHYWIGQSFINAGVTCFRAKDEKGALEWYQKAHRHGHAHKDFQLAGRAAGNLSQLERDSNPKIARSLLDESIQLKRLAGDREGLLSAILQRGSLEASEGNLVRAMKSFQTGLRLCRKADYPYAEALTLHNIGRCNLDMGKLAPAARSFKRSYKLAAELNDQETQLIAAVGEGVACFNLGQFADAEVAFQNLLQIASDLSDVENKLCALHGLSVTQLIRKKTSAGLRHLEIAIQLARKNSNEEWLLRCLQDRCRNFRLGPDALVDERRLTSVALKESRCGHNKVASQLWRSLAIQRVEREQSTASILEAFEKAIECSERVPNSHLWQWMLLTEVFGWLWTAGSYLDAIELLNRAEKVAAAGKLVPEHSKCVDQHGVCLQELGQYHKAISFHQKALALANRCKDPELQENALNNLGEAFRHLEQSKKAHDLFKRAEVLALTRGDKASAISIAHNRALVLEDLSRNADASKLLCQCRDHSRRLKLWYEYIRALEGLANLETYQSRPALAQRFYKGAIRAAKSRGLQESLPRLVLNYSRFLHWRGKTTAALLEFKQIERDISRRVDAHTYYLTQGMLYLSAGKYDRAIRAFESGVEHAARVGDEEGLVGLVENLSEAREKKKQFAKSRGELLQAIQSARTPEVKARLLVQRFRMELGMRDEKLAERTFAEARDLTDQSNLLEYHVDLHMILGDHEWKGGGKSKLNALKAYASAMGRAFELALSQGKLTGESMSEYNKVGMHILRKITMNGRSLSTATLNSLMEDLELWFKEQVGQRAKSLRFLLWPFRLAQMTYPFADNPARLAEETQRLLKSNEIMLVAN